MTTNEIANITKSAAEYWKIASRHCHTCGKNLYLNITIQQPEWSYYRCPECKKNYYSHTSIIRRIKPQDEALDAFHQLQHGADE